MQFLQCFRIVFIILPLFSYSQNNIYKPYTIPDTIPSKYIFDAGFEYKNLIQNRPSFAKKRNFKKFAESVILYKSDLFTNGNVYFDFRETEEYVNQVLQKILPDSLKNSKGLSVYIVRDATPNAFTIHDGTIFLNIGYLAETYNEAALAFTLAHEVSHYIHHDVYFSFINDLKIKRKKNEISILKSTIKSAGYSREQEKNADLTGLKMTENSGYNILYSLCDFKLLHAEEEKEKLQSGKSKLSSIETTLMGTKISSKLLTEMLASHPELVERIDYIQNYLNSTQRIEKKREFIVSENLFKTIQSSARYETLNILLKDGDYRGCAGKAFKYYLLFPEDNNFVYYLLESVRRLVYLDYTIKKKGFLTDKFTSDKFSAGQGIMHDISYLEYDSIVRSGIKATELLDTNNILFETYEQAFDYFKKLALKRQITEAYLTIGLYNLYDTSNCSNYLKEYINVPGALHSEFAKSVLHDSIQKSIQENQNNIFLIDEFGFYNRLKNGYRKRLSHEEKVKSKYYTLINNNFSKKIKSGELNIEEVLNKKNQMDIFNYKYVLDIARFNKKGSTVSTYYSEFSDIAAGKEISFFLVDPDLWEFFKSKKIRSINYFSFVGVTDYVILKRKLNPLNCLEWPFLILQSPFKSFYKSFYMQAKSYSIDTRVLKKAEKDKGLRLTPKRSLRTMKKITIKDFEINS